MTLTLRQFSDEPVAQATPSAGLSHSRRHRSMTINWLPLQAVFFQGATDPEVYPRPDGTVYVTGFPDNPGPMQEQPGQVRRHCTAWNPSSAPLHVTVITCGARVSCTPHPTATPMLPYAT